jgi:galactose-1-phosphate uridylyltransferase
MGDANLLSSWFHNTDGENKISFDHHRTDHHTITSHDMQSNSCTYDMHLILRMSLVL